MRFWRIIFLSSWVVTLSGTTAPVAQFPKDKVLTFLTDVIEWHRRLPTPQRISAEPSDILFIEDNVPITAEIARLSFEFGKAAAVMEAQRISSDSKTKYALPKENDLKFLIAAKAKIDMNILQGQQELRAALEAKPANFKDRKKLKEEMADLAQRIQILSSISVYYKNLLELSPEVSQESGSQTNMSSLVESLERRLTEVSGSASGSSEAQKAAGEGTRPRGVARMITRLSALSRKAQVADRVINRTKLLNKSIEDLRTQVRDSFRGQFEALTLESTDLTVLNQQKTRMADLFTQANAVLPLFAILRKEQTLLSSYESNLSAWRSDIRTTSRNAWNDLIIRCGMLLAAFATLIGAGVIARRFTDKHVHDTATRRVFVTGERVVLWVIAIVLVLIAFAFDLGSLATFFGLLAAGLAVGLRDVLLSVGGYMVLLYRFRVQPGDRVEICGVMGEVRKIGLIDFEIGELDKSTGELTGRVLAFSNSCVFVAPAIPLFRGRTGAALGLTRA